MLLCQVDAEVKLEMESITAPDQSFLLNISGTCFFELTQRLINSSILNDCFKFVSDKTRQPGQELEQFYKLNCPGACRGPDINTYIFTWVKKGKATTGKV